MAFEYENMLGKTFEVEGKTFIIQQMQISINDIWFGCYIVVENKEKEKEKEKENMISEETKSNLRAGLRHVNTAMEQLKAFMFGAALENMKRSMCYFDKVAAEVLG